MDPRNKPIWRVFSVSSPAAGQGFSITPDTAAHWLIRTLRFTFVTSATAANRDLRLTISDGTTEYFSTATADSQVASTTTIYGAHPGANETVDASGFSGIRTPVDGFWLPPGHTLSVDFDNIDTTDQISSIGGLRLEFPTGPSMHAWPFLPVISEETS